MEKVKVYGADWCGMTKRSRNLLEELKVDYDFIDIDDDKAGAAWVREQNADGKERKPTIKIGAKVLIEPNDEELSEALKAGGSVKGNLGNQERG